MRSELGAWVVQSQKPRKRAFQLRGIAHKPSILPETLPEILLAAHNEKRCGRREGAEASWPEICWGFVLHLRGKYYSSAGAGRGGEVMKSPLQRAAAWEVGKDQSTLGMGPFSCAGLLQLLMLFDSSPGLPLASAVPNIEWNHLIKAGSVSKM